MRLGCTSYIYPTDIITNVRRLAGRVKDVELVIFEVDDQANNLPDESTVAELCRIASYHDITYTVHLPLDLGLGLAEDSASLDKALRVIRSTKALNPYGYIVHLDGGPALETDAYNRSYKNLSSIRNDDSSSILPKQESNPVFPGVPRVPAFAETRSTRGKSSRKDLRDQSDDIFETCSRRWRDNSLRSLAMLTEEVEGPALLCVENLENQNGQMISAILDAMPVSCCADIGHFWKQGTDPLPWLEAWLDRMRVVHLHGVGERDHKSLSIVPPSSLDSVVDFLVRRFNGVVTLEVFNERDWIGSLEVLQKSAARLGVTVDM